MKNIYLNVIIFLLAFNIFYGKAIAQTSLNDYNIRSGQIMSNGIDGIGNIVSSIISDSFTPMTHYNEGDFNFNAVPAWFDVQKAYDSPEIKGKDLKGLSGGLGAGYALNDDLLIYGIAAFMKMKGKLYGDYYKEYSDPMKADMDYNLFSILFGAGYDLFGGKWSMPVFTGMFIQYYNTKIELPAQTGSITIPVVLSGDIKTEFSGNGFLYGANTGMALSRELFDSIKITPYFLYLFSFNKAELNNETSIASSYSYKSEIEGQRVSAGMLGLCLTLMGSKGYSFSFSLGGILTSSSSWYNEKLLNGLEMKSVVFVLTYTTNFNKIE
ncbi:hypothetical protein JW758_03455 [Candidatus Peregrinibacteria bacterium]|nr:hypothetical protein [Candidatus Peregrinibacteria bacterium]